MSTERTAKLRFLPYPFESSALATMVKAAELDGRDVSGRINEEHHTVDLSSESPWDSLQLTLDARFDPDISNRILPEMERENPPLRLVARIRCTKTRLRKSAPFAIEQWRGGKATLHMTLLKSQLRHEVEVLPMLVRSAGGTPGVSQHAWQPMARLAQGRSWSIQVDKAPPLNAKYLDIRFHNFSDLPQAHPDGLYYLDCEGTDPVLWLNNRNQEVATTLQSKGTTGPRARLRDVLFAQIEIGVWQQLFASAAADLVDGEVKKGWQKAVLDEWLSRLLPEFADSESRIAELERLSSPKERADLLSRLDALLQSRAKYERGAHRLIREVLQ